MKGQIGIDLNKFEKYLVQNYGKKCRVYTLGCFTCQVWEMYKKLKLFIELDNDFKKGEKTKHLYKFK